MRTRHSASQLNQNLALAIAVLGLSGCGLFDFTSDAPPAVTLRGTVAVPDVPSDLVVLSQDIHLAYTWSSCPDTGNDSALRSDGSFLLESTSNCAGAQYVYFYSESALNLEAFSAGTMSFYIQANNAGQNLQLLIQDSDANSSNTLNLANYGFSASASNIAVDQKIEIPIAELVNAGFNLGAVKRVFQLLASCPNANCFTTISNIRWVYAGDTTAAAAPGLTRQWPRCEPRSCKAVPQARVGIFRPGQNGWTAEPTADVTFTDTSGEFYLEVDLEILEAGGPFFLAASARDGSLTLLSPIPGDLIEKNASLDLAIDRTTTAASVMVCPNGLTIPADGSGGWCIGDPVSTTELEPLYDTIDLALTVSVSVEIEIIVEDALDDGDDVLDALNRLLNAQGIQDVTTDDILAAVAGLDLPRVPVPGTGTPNDSDDDASSSGGNFSSDQCSEYLTCDVCSISACVSASQSSCEAGYKTSDGAYFQCASCSDCFTAAQNATNRCCPVQ